MEELHISSELDVIITRTKGTRVIITQTVSITHPTKDVVIGEYLQAHNLCELDTTSDFIHRRISLTARPLGHIAVDNKIAEVKKTYELLVPENMIVRKG
jgi:hypothetical protein